MDAIALFDPISSAAFLKDAAKELGFKVVGVFTKPTTLLTATFHTTEESLFSGCDEVIISEQREEIVTKLRECKFTIRAAIAGVDSAVELVDEISHDLKLFGNSLAESKARRDKGEMRKLLKQNGFSCPDFELCKTKEKVLTFVEKHSLPLVIKTPKGAATSQVYICEDSERLIEKFHDILHRRDFYGKEAIYAVLEEYISGKEYVANTFSDGEDVHVTDLWVYDKIDTDTFKNIYYNCISLPLSDPAMQPIILEATRLVKAFGIIRGAAHLEIKDDPRRGATLVEINPRLAGARMPFLLKEHSNFDPYKKTIEVFVHGKTRVPKPILMKKHCAIAFCPVLESGEVRSVSGIEEIEKLDSYEAYVLNVKVGERLAATTDLTTTPLFVFLAHADRARLLKDLERAHSLFSVTLTPI